MRGVAGDLAGCGGRQQPSAAGPDHRDPRAGGRQRARVRRRAVHVERGDNHRERQVVRHARPGHDRGQDGAAADRDLRRVGVERANLVERQGDQAQRRERDDPVAGLEAVRAVGAVALAGGIRGADRDDATDEHAARAGHRVVHLAPRQHDLGDPVRHPHGVGLARLADLAVTRRVEVQELDLEHELGRTRRTGAVEAIGSLRCGPSWLDHPH